MSDEADSQRHCCHRDQAAAESRPSFQWRLQRLSLAHEPRPLQ